MLSCKEVAHRISSAQDTQLTLASRWQIRLHLLVCRACRNFDRQMQALANAMRKMSKEPESYIQVELPDAARQRIRRSLIGKMRKSNPE